MDVEGGCRLFLAYCGAEVGVACMHMNDLGREEGTAIIPLPNVAMAILPDHEAELRLFQPMRHVLPHVYSLEERDLFGRTSLLASVEGVQRSQLPKVAQMLLQFGANPLALDNGGAGMLHFILRTTSGCNNGTATEECMKPMKELMVQLLKAGCDPNLLDEDNRTPSDMALSPVAWVLWCEVVHAAGLDLMTILERDDKLRGAVFSRGYVETKYKHVLHTSPPSWSDRSAQPDSGKESDSLCDYCTLPDHWCRSRPPFDTAGSYMVSAGDSAVHAFFSNHRDGTFCADAISWGLCKRRCHIEWSVKAISWRKHVAYRLWKDGILRTPSQAYTWTTGCDLSRKIF